MNRKSRAERVVAILLVILSGNLWLLALWRTGMTEVSLTRTQTYLIYPVPALAVIGALYPHGLRLSQWWFEERRATQVEPQPPVQQPDGSRNQ